MARREFNRIEVSAVAVNAGHAEVRIGRRVAMSGEMLHRGQHSGFMRALDVGCDQIADLLRVLAEGTRVDDGIFRVGIDVGVRKEVPVNADGAGFFGGDAAEGFGVFHSAVGAEGHGVRENGASHQAHGDAAFKICGKQQRQLRFALQAVEQLGSFIGLAPE